MDDLKSTVPAPVEARPPAARDPLGLQPASRPAPTPVNAPTLRDFAMVLFRHRGLIAIAFLAIFAGVVVYIWTLPKEYETSMKILVRRERPDPVVSPAFNAQSPVQQDVTVEDLNSEVELLRSRDLLEKIAVSCGLNSPLKDSLPRRVLNFVGLGRKAPATAQARVEAAALTLAKLLRIEPIARSKMIDVRYTSQDPGLAARVLQTLAALYLQKHLEVHRPPGALDFFQQQTDLYRKGLEKAERRLAEFGRKEQVVSVELEKDITLRKLSDFEAQLRETRAAEGAVEQRIASLEKQAAAKPARVITQVKTSDNSLLLQQLKSTLLNLELRRTELLTKYEPGYRAVQEVDTQIAQAREALALAEVSALRDETSDLDRTRQWLDEELARARAESATLKGRATEIAKSLEAYRQSARQIAGREIANQDMVREAKTAEENYLLYQRKQEEARISDALDRKRIVNVTVAVAATAPELPTSPPRSLYLVVGFFLACATSVGLAMAVDCLDPRFRTPKEVEEILGVPVIASFPRS